MLIIKAGETTKAYLAVRNKDVYLEKLLNDDSIKVSSRMPGVVRIIAHDVVEQDPSEGALPTVWSGDVVGVEASAVPVTVTAVFTTLKNGNFKNTLAQDQVKVIKTGESGGVLFGKDVFLITDNASVPAEETAEVEEEEQDESPAPPTPPAPPVQDPAKPDPAPAEDHLHATEVTEWNQNAAPEAIVEHEDPEQAQPAEAETATEEKHE